eukprot:scaffold6036_cov371-Prasinococcus_capsulatus_cf.AAC.11
MCIYADDSDGSTDGLGGLIGGMIGGITVLVVVPSAVVYYRRRRARANAALAGVAAAEGDVWQEAEDSLADNIELSSAVPQTGTPEAVDFKV